MAHDDTFISLEKEFNLIALESQVLSNVASTLKNIFPSIVEKVKNSFTKTKDLPEIEIKLSTEQAFITNEIHHFKYLDVAELSVNYPEGFIGDYLEYATDLLAIVKSMKDINKDSLDPFFLTLSTFLTNKEEKFSTKDLTQFYSNIRKQRQGFIDIIAKHYDHNAPVIAKTKILHLVSRNTDFKTLFTVMNTLKKEAETINLKLVNDNCSKIAQLLDLVIKRADQGAITNVSPEVLKNLSIGSYEIASEIEFLSIVYYQVLILISAVDAMTSRVNNFIKDIPTEM